jgi:histidinol-phosphate aminotransferase
LGLSAEEVTDFSASINPIGPPRTALLAAQSIELGAYPDTECVKLKRAIASALDVQTANVLPGNGSTELIHLIARAFLGPDDAAVVFAPTFGEYAAACRVEGVETTAIEPPKTGAGGNGFEWDIPRALGPLAQVTPSLVFLCNPNNPTGVYLSEASVRSVAEVLQGVGILVLDEAYVSFVDEPWDSIPLLSMGNVVLLRSMTKDYALTGLRLGYLLAPEGLVGWVRRFQYSWSVNAAAQAAGIAALSDRGHVKRGRETVREGKEYLTKMARGLGVECAPASANFLLMKVGRGQETRAALLREHRICVRDCASFGLPEYIRVGVRIMGDNCKLIDGLRQVLSQRVSVA